MDRADQDKIFAYLITSARECIDEPPLYGPLRLLDAYSLFLKALKPEEADEFYIRLEKKLEEFKDKCMSEEKQFVNGLDEALEMLTEHIISKQYIKKG